MTSPLNTSVKYFDSLMPNAPVLNGTAGALIALLDACLKDGFNTTSVTVNVASNVATVSWASGTFAAYSDSVVLLAGVTGGPTGWANLNGEQKVTSKSALSLTFPTSGVADGAATGTITVKMAPVGWGKAFTGTNLAAYQSSDPTSTKCLLRVDDTNATFARVVGYEQMTDVNTGSGAFPTAAQMSGGGYWAKSSSANSNAVSWSLVADSKTLYLTVLSSSSSGSTFQVGATRAFGDLVAYRPGGDAYACFLNYSVNSTVASQTDGAIGNQTSGQLQCALPREYTGLGSAVLNGVYPIGGSTAGSLTYSSGGTSIMGTFPSNVDGGLWTLPMYLLSSASASPRGAPPGVQYCPQSGTFASFKQGDTVPGSGALAGRTLVAATCSIASTFGSVSTSANTGNIFFDRTGPWR